MVGALLILASTVVGARLLGTGPAGTPVWVARHALAAGIVLRAEDLEARTVQLSASAPQYLDARTPLPVGVTLRRDLGAGELVPAAAIGPAASAAPVRAVTIPVEHFHVAPDLARGERVDVYVTPEAGAAAKPTAELVARSVDVIDVDDDGGRFGGESATTGVTLSVPAAGVGALVGAVGHGTVDVVRVPVPAS